MHGFIAFYNDKQIEVYADSLYQAKTKAVELLKVRPKQAHMVSVVLAEKNGETVTHSTTEF